LTVTTPFRSFLLAAILLPSCGGTASTGAPPTAPASVAASAQGSTSVLLSWDPSAGATAYLVQRAPDAGGAPGAWGSSTSVAASPHTDTGLAASTTYWYRVAATGSGGDSTFSSPVSATTQPPGGGGGSSPATPTGVAALSLSASAVRVSWDAATGATFYAVQRAPDAAGSPGTWGASTDVAASPHTDSGLAASTTYWYRVSASNTAGTSSFSTPVSATTQATGVTAPSTPTGVVASPLSSSSIRVSWTASAGATSYAVQRAPDASGSPGSWGASTNVTAGPYTDSGLTASTTYWYRVAASNTAGASSFTTPASATTQSSGGGGAITTIPAALSVLSTKRIFFAHASVGGNILGGIQTLLDANSGAEPRIVDLAYPTPSPGAVTVGTIGQVAWGDALNQRPFEKVAAFQSFLNGGGMGGAADIAMMKFCFVDFDAGASSVETNARAQDLFNSYQAMVGAVQAANPGVKLVHFTSAITPTGNGRREAYNNLIRSAYRGSGRLFDLADLESNGHTDSEGRVLDPAYSLDGEGHLNSAGKAVVSEALLLFLANLP
jgi:chitodextrinase